MKNAECHALSPETRGLFEELPRRLYGQRYDLERAPDGLPFFIVRGASGAVLARAAVWTNPDVRYLGETPGLIGSFECIDDAECAAASTSSPATRPSPGESEKRRADSWCMGWWFRGRVERGMTELGTPLGIIVPKGPRFHKEKIGSFSESPPTVKLLRFHPVFVSYGLLRPWAEVLWFRTAAPPLLRP